MQEFAPFGPLGQLFGVWVAALLTVALYSFLVKDNPLYKLAEHVFVGTSAGYFIARYTHDIILKKCITLLFAPEIPVGEARPYGLIIPLVLGILMLCKLIPGQEWIARWPLSFVVGTGVGIQIISYFQSNCITQVAATLRPFSAMESLLDHEMAVLLSVLGKFLAVLLAFAALGVAVYLLLRMQRVAHGFEAALGVLVAAIALASFFSRSETVNRWFVDFATYYGGLINGVLLAGGVVCGLIYFFFSQEHKGLVFGGCARVGIWFLMVSFGASFGYTVMGRISLLIGRIDFLLRLPEMTTTLLSM